MTHFSDSMRIGAVNTPPIVRQIPGQDQGLLHRNLQRYSIVPLAITADNIVASAIVNGAATLAAGTGVTSSTTAIPQAQGTTVLVLDVPRAITITGTAGGVTAVNFTVTGYDVYFQPMTQTFLGPAATATTTSLKAFKYISSITSAATTTAAVTIGTSDVMGLPYLMTLWDDFLSVTANSVKLTAATGFVAGVVTSPNTAALGDVRGTYALQTASDGTKRFTFYMNVQDPNTAEGSYGVLPA